MYHKVEIDYLLERLETPKLLLAADRNSHVIDKLEAATVIRELQARLESAGPQCVSNVEP